MSDKNEGAKVDDAVFHRQQDEFGTAQAFEMTRGKTLAAIGGGTVLLSLIAGVIAFQMAG